MPRSPLLVINAVSFQKPYKLMCSQSAAASFHGLMTLARRSIDHLHAWNALLGCIVPALVPLGLCGDAEKGRIAVRHPMAKDKSANKDCGSGKQAVEEVKGAYSADADKVEQCSLD